jgi:hypothetical protein
LGAPDDGQHPPIVCKETMMDAATSMKRPEPWNKGKVQFDATADLAGETDLALDVRIP